MDGSLVVYKPQGCSSHDLVERVRKAWGVKTGHAGTLDPMAQGVLVMFLGRALKILQYVPPEALDKTYLLRITLGVATDSYDATGQIVSQTDIVPDHSKETILEHLRSFVGTYNQQPPAFSAIKIQGKRAYELARAGQKVDLAKRPVHVTSIRLVDDLMLQGRRNLVLRIHCSRGTYVRSIAQDLGEKLGCGAHLSYLLRERVGHWYLNNALPPWQLDPQVNLSDHPGFTPLPDILPFPKLHIFPEAEAKIANGAPLDQKDIKSIKAATGLPDGDPMVQVFSTAGTFLALYRPGGPDKRWNQQRLVPVRVL